MTSTDSQSPPSPPTHREVEVRALRRWAAWVGIPLLLSALLPVHRAGEWYTTWGFADRVNAEALNLLPVAAVALLAVAFVPKLAPAVRALLALLAATTILFVAHELMSHPHVVRDVLRSMRRVEKSALTWLLVAPILACAADVAMARRVHDKRWVLVAFVAWAHLAFRMIWPLREDDLETSPLGALLDGEPGGVFAFPLFLLALIGMLRAFVRFVRLLVVSREKRETWRPGRAWLALLVAIPPVLLVLVVTTILVLSDASPTHLPLVFDVSVLLWALLAGGAFGLAHGTLAIDDGLRDFVQRLRDPGSRRGALVALAILAVPVALLGARATWRAVGPDPRVGDLADLAQDIGETVIASGMGRDYDTGLHGGYSEFDLRGSRGSLAEHVSPDAELTPEVIAFEIVANAERLRFGTTIVVVGDRVRWSAVNLDPSWGHMHELGRADDALEGIAVRTAEGLRGDCLPTPTAEERALLPPGLVQIDSVVEACARAEDEVRPAHLGDFDGATGRLGGYVVIAEGGGTRVRLVGNLYNDAGRLWVGRFQVDESE